MFIFFSHFETNKWFSFVFLIIASAIFYLICLSRRRQQPPNQKGIHKKLIRNNLIKPNETHNKKDKEKNRLNWKELWLTSRQAHK